MPDPAYVLSRHAQRRVDRRQIRVEWIAETLKDPDRVDPDRQDPTVRHALKKIPEMEHRVLRVVYNPTVQPVRVVSVHFDRRLRGKL
jgi:hypothetical protein